MSNPDAWRWRLTVLLRLASCLKIDKRSFTMRWLEEWTGSGPIVSNSESQTSSANKSTSAATMAAGRSV